MKPESVATPDLLLQYKALVDGGEFIEDAEQLRAVAALDGLCRRFHHHRHPNLWDRFLGRQRNPVKGLYLWGSVGRGKTWLMDLFFDHLPLKHKQRMHFHRFMQRVHTSLKGMEKTQDPLPQLARSWADECHVLCLDEFFVSDIADAMLLDGLLRSFFDNGVTLVTTSNIEPDGLYRDGLQRAKFLPAIDLLKKHTQVLHIGGDTDFRLRILEQSEIFHCPLDEQADRLMAVGFVRMSAGVELDCELEINGRPFRAVRRGDGIIWFDFDELCAQPRGSIDYIEIARSFNTVMLSNVPQMKTEDANAARRFIIMVDEFYDRNVKLLVSAAVPIDDLYTGEMLAFEFQRTASRLTEMQSHDYLARPHLP